MEASRSDEPVLEVRGLVKHFPLTKGIVFKRQVGAVRAVDGIDFKLYKGETLGIVGESGCGKSTTGRLLMRLDDPTEGQIFFHGEDIAKLQALNILVDGAPEDSGMLLQIFTQNLIGPIFFEIIQRKGNEGFGEGNFKALFESIELDQIRRGVISAD